MYVRVKNLEETKPILIRKKHGQKPIIGVAPCSIPVTLCLTKTISIIT